MNLVNLNDPLPKPWLNINANTVNATQLLINGVPIGFPSSTNYNANITAGANLSNIAGSQVTQVLRIDNIYNLSGSFTATVAASIGKVDFDITLPPGTTSALNNYRSCQVSGHINDVVGFLSFVPYSLSNTASNILNVAMQTCNSGNEPGAPTNNVSFNYNITFTAS